MPMTANLFPSPTIPQSIMALDKAQAMLYKERDDLYDDMHMGRIPPALKRKTNDRLLEIERRICSQASLIMHLLVEHHENNVAAVAKAEEFGLPDVKLPEPESKFDLRVLQAVRRDRRAQRREVRRLSFD